MSQKIETRLIIKKETKIDQIREKIFLLFFGESYYEIKQWKQFLQRRTPRPNHIVIPKEIILEGKRK